MSVFNVGGLLTEYRLYSFKNLQLRHITLEHITMIEDMSAFKRAEYIHTFLSHIMLLDADKIWDLTLGDITYIFTLLRAKCYTQTPVTVTWDCRAMAYADPLGHFLFNQSVSTEEVEREGYVLKECDRKNSDLVYSNNYKYNPIMLENFEHHPIFHIPTLRDQYIMDELSDRDDWDTHKAFSDFLLCCPGTTVDDKLSYLDNGATIKDIHAAKPYLNSILHGIEYSYTLDCKSCGNKPKVKKMLDIYSVLPIIDQDSIMNIQYSVLRDHSSVLPEETPVLKALYWFNMMKKDRQEREAKRRTQKGK